MNLSAVAMTLLLTLSGANAASPGTAIILFETDTFTMGVGVDGRLARFVDRQSGTDYLNGAAGAVFATVRTGAESFPATAMTFDKNLLTVDFGGIDGRAVFRVTAERQRLVFQVTSFTCDRADDLVFAPVPLTLRGEAAEPFGVSPLALNLKTNCLQIPGLCSGLSGFIAYKRFGFVGAEGAIIAAPTDDVRDALKDAVKSSPGLAYSPLGGPFALDAAINQGSYLIDMGGTISESTVDAWIDAARSVGATQIDLHGGHGFRWGDFEVNREVYPRGRESLKAVVDAIHKAGLAAGLHTYAFFVAKDTPWVTPVPDPRLDKDATFTLSGDLEEVGASVAVDESTETMSEVTGFQVRNSATLQVDEELITYTGVAKQAPFAFTGCVRGAYGTRPTRHGRGAKVLHLKECFGLFVPQGDSTLLTEVAERTADLYNACGFDMLHLDALDGSDILGGPQFAWHYESKFTHEIIRRLEKPAVMEMSTFSHHLWCVRSRMEAWDCPARGVKDFVDCHVLRNQQWKSAFFPTHLGWWGTFEWSGVQPERSWPDDMEYVCAKALATDSSLSFIVGFTPESLQRGNAQRLASIARRYEDLRRAGTVPNSIKARLAAPGAEFTLDAGGQFRPTTYSKHRMTMNEGPRRMPITNPYGPQPLRLRIESLLAPEDYDSPANKTLADMRNVGEFGNAATQQGVTATLEQAPEASSKDASWAAIVAQNTDVEKGRAWAAFRKDFEASVDLANQGLGLWVEGDGQGELLNVQVKSPQHLAGGIADHYITVDFTGRRYFELVEPESEELSRYEWAHTRRRSDWPLELPRLMSYVYPMYHIWVDYHQIASLTIGINNIPVGKSVKVNLGPIKAMPLRASKLVNPSVTVGERTVRFPVELDSGCYLEYLSQADCKVYDARGECIGNVTPNGDAPVVAQGENVFMIASDAQATEPARARVTVMTYGEPLVPTE